MPKDFQSFTMWIPGVLRSQPNDLTLAVDPRSLPSPEQHGNPSVCRAHHWGSFSLFSVEL